MLAVKFQAEPSNCSLHTDDKVLLFSNGTDLECTSIAKKVNSVCRASVGSFMENPSNGHRDTAGKVRCSLTTVLLRGLEF